MASRLLSAFLVTPPVPCSRTVWPAMTFPCSTRACQAVNAAQGNVAPSSTDRGAGILTTPSSSNITYSASMPSMLPPRASCRIRGRLSPRPALEEAAGHLLPDLHTRDAGAYLDHLTGVVGKRDDIIANRHAVGATDDAQIAEVELNTP